MTDEAISGIMNGGTVVFPELLALSKEEFDFLNAGIRRPDAMAKRYF